MKDLFPNLQPLQSPIAKRSSEQAYETTVFNKDGTFVMQEKFYKQFVDFHSSLKFLLSSARTELYCDPA